MRRIILISFTLMFALAAIAADEPCPPAWSYEGATGPGYWGSLDPKWKACAAGLLQSPLDITQVPFVQDNTIPWLTQRYPTSATVNISNTSRAVKVYPTTTVEILRNNTAYKLYEFHFHVPKEHTTGTSGDAKAELHLVHKSADGKETVVIAVFISEGPANAELQKLIDKVPAACATPNAATGVDLTKLLPATLNRYFTYIGSLTTPPCDEGLTWIILNDGITASTDQIAKLKVVRDNARPLQPRMRWRSVG